MIAWLKGADSAARAILALFVAAIALCLILAVLNVCSARDDARKAEAGQTMAEGRTGAAQDASGIRDRADARNDQITQAVTKGTTDVRQAPDRSAANLAARRGVCRVNPSAGPDCRMLLSDSGRVD
ncbi:MULTISPECIES: hypothetical protein [Brevundimonas]|uniref:hypothetical protein n=1 Tax=Brevundimonas TaxID=41275 RepID=UPI000AFF7C90|nr:MULTISPECIES: hypothetical protein [Brevundimonas]MCC4295869.1 hypothetical protein [Brevundimonas aurantiaca]